MEPDAQDAVVAQQVAEVAEALGARADELTGELIGLYERELPHLVHDDERMVSLLSGSVYQNLDTALRIFQYGIDPTRVEAPAAAMEYARRLAQRGTPVIELIRAYQLGQTAILDKAFAEAAVQVSDPHLLGESTRLLLGHAFTFIDRVTQQVVTAYERERDRWMRNRSAVRAARVRALLGDETVDVDASEAALGYRLRGDQLCVIAWYPPSAHPEDGIAGLESAVGKLVSRHVGDVGSLFVPHDELCAWVWLPSGKPVPARVLDAVLAESDADVRFAVGEPGRGLAGFRSSHRQALRVHALALAAGPGSERAMTFREVGAMALMTSDLAAARRWVEDTLGALAADDVQHERLRDTLRVFLALGGSYTAAAAELTMHKNSVQYRVRKAEELLGRPVADTRLDIELALNLCHRLGAAVLTRS